MLPSAAAWADDPDFLTFGAGWFDWNRQKKQAAEIVREEAERCGMFFVTERWLGGMLTNWQTIRQSIRHLEHLDRISTDGTYEKLKKKEVLLLEKERARLQRTLAGIRNMGGLPGLVFIIDYDFSTLESERRKNLKQSKEIFPHHSPMCGFSF